MLPYNTTLKKTSQKLRRETTDSERLLWSRLRGKQVLGIQFYRQKPIGNYVVDFYSAAAKLVVELDGGQHFDNDQLRRDGIRAAFLESLGLTVIRFDNRQVMMQLNGVVAEICRIATIKIPPGPPFSKGETT